MIAATTLLLLPLLRAGPAGPENPRGTADPALKQQIVALAAKNDNAGVAKLMKSRKEDSIAWIVATSEEILNKPSEDGEKFAEILRNGWKEGVGGEFAEREYKNLKEMGPNRRDRNDLKARLDLVEADLA